MNSPEISQAEPALGTPEREDKYNQKRQELLRKFEKGEITHDELNLLLGKLKNEEILG